MTLSISDVTYTYPITPTIGSEDIYQISLAKSNTIGEIIKAYRSLFNDYTEKASQLLSTLNTILTEEKLNFNDLKNIDKIFDKDSIIAKNSEDYIECKEGLKAYKFYLKEALTKLYNLYVAIENAKNDISELENLEAATQERLNDEAHVIITKLQCADKQAQDILKDFSEYSIVKTLTVTKYINYNDGENNHWAELVDQSTYQCIEKGYRNYGNTDDFIKKIQNCKGISDLRTIQTTKEEVSRNYITSYYKNDGNNQLTDKYDLLAKQIQDLKEDLNKTTESNLALFDELTLLEKLQYIRIYYSDTTENARYVYPQNNSFGYPCVEPKKSEDALNDTKELGQLEIFYLGYIVNRDGPINALASFLEIKTSAIKSQIKVLMERIKAIKAYSSLLQKGFEQFSKAAATYGEGNPPSIPKAAFYIYRYISTSATRCFKYINGESYIMIQYSRVDEKDFCNDTNKGTDSIAADNWNESPSKYYILVKPTEEGLNDFVNFLNGIPTLDNPCKDIHQRTLDILFAQHTYKSCPNTDVEYYKYPPIRLSIMPQTHYHIFLKSVDIKNKCSFSYYIRADISKFDKWLFTLNNTNWEAINTDNNVYWKENTITCDGTNVKFYKEENKKDLPKKLDVPKMAGTDMTNVYYQDGFAWNDLTPDNIEKQNALPSYFNLWQNGYETQIANYKSNLEQQEKDISALQKKIQTFDATTTNFRNKAFNVYNKIVNKIK